MWPTSSGMRTLRGSEAALVASAISVMIDAFHLRLRDDELDEQESPPPDSQTGIAVFDSLTLTQRIAVLQRAAKYLLTGADGLTADRLSAIDDATVAAIYAEVRDQVAIEIDLCDIVLGADRLDGNRERRSIRKPPSHWRSLIFAALRESAIQIDDLTEINDSRLQPWEDAVEVLANEILWDRDFELADGFLDEQPDIARQRKRLLGISDQYFIQPAPDPDLDQVHRMLAEIRGYTGRCFPKRR